MNDPNFIKRAHIALIQTTENPVAPIIVQQAADGIEGLGKLMASVANREHVNTYSEVLMSGWSDPGQLDAICGKPAFVMALCGMLKESLRQYVHETTQNHKEQP